MGVIENMAGFVCPTCSTVTQIFSGTTGEELAKHLQVPYLGSVPLDPGVSDASDKGVPSIVAQPERPQAAAFKAIAGKLAQQASIASLTRKDLIQPGDGQERPKFSPV